MSDLDDQDQALIAKLRALPPEGVEPDWQKLQAAIRAEVGDEAPRPWWRNWRWIVPIWALATTAAIALLVTRAHPHQAAQPSPVMPVAPIAVTPSPPAPSIEHAPAVWLDGESVDIGEGDIELPDAIATEEAADGFDLQWIDELDDREINSVEQWLSHKRS